MTDAGKCWIAVGAASAFLGVAFGAFGAHALAAKLDDYSMRVFQTAVQYQMWHAVALVALGAWAAGGADAAVARADVARIPGFAFAIGTVIFSGSLYALALSGVKILGAVTPFGGLSFLIGWALLFWGAWRA